MKKTIFKILTISLTAVFAAFFAACPEEPGNDGGPGGHDIDKALYGTWEVENSSVLTITFSSEDGIEWGGTVGSSYNSLPVDKWTANNGVISMTYAGDTYTVYNYTINGSGELVLTSPDTNIERTLVKTAGSGVFGDFEYNFGKSYLTITGYTGTGGVVEIPSAINGKSVTSIYGPYYGAFQNYGAFQSKHLTGVTIPDGVTSIGSYAFYDNQLTSVTIPNSVIEIGEYAFANNQLTSVTIPNGVTIIMGGAFANNKLTSVTIPNGVTNIMGGAFANNQLTSVTIGSGVTYIGGSAFANNQLTNVTVDSGNTKYAVKNDFLMSKDEKSLILYFGSSKSVVIPDSVTDIGDYAFADNQLTSVTIGNSVTYIGGSAFANNQLTSVTIPNSVTRIGEYAFADNQLTSVTIPNSVTDIYEGAFSNNQLTSVTIPNSVTYIGGYAFADNQLTSVTIGAGVSMANGFPGNFVSVYIKDRLAGTYTCPTAGSNSTWTRQNP